MRTIPQFKVPQSKPLLNSILVMPCLCCQTTSQTSSSHGPMNHNILFKAAKWSNFSSTVWGLPGKSCVGYIVSWTLSVTMFNQPCHHHWCKGFSRWNGLASYIRRYQPYTMKTDTSWSRRTLNRLNMWECHWSRPHQQHNNLRRS